MERFIDLSTGKLYRFKQAVGSDVNKGLSDSLILTPKSLAESNLLCNTSIPLVLHSPFKTKSALFAVNSHVLVIPLNGCFYPNRSVNIKAQYFANAYAHSGLSGELCLVDIATRNIVNGSILSFSNSSYQTLSSSVFTVESGKVYSFALRRTKGATSKMVYLRGATLTLKFLVA